MIRLAYSILPFALCSALFASSSMDERHAFRRLAVAVVNVAREPVHGEHVERELKAWVQSSGRFEEVEIGSAFLKDWLRGAGVYSLGENETAVPVAPLKVPLTNMAQYGIDGVVLAEVQRRNDGYRLVLALVNAHTEEAVHGIAVPVEPSDRLEGFAEAARRGASALAKAIPFDATVLSREKKRVVLDRGRDVLRAGQRLTTYTIEKSGSGLIFEPTGEIEVTQPESTLSFGRVLSREEAIFPGNKIRLEPVPRIRRELSSAGDRETGITSASGSELPLHKGTFGVVNVYLGPSFVHFSNTGAAGSGSLTQDATCPGGLIDGELWLTERIFLNLAFGMASARLTNGTGVTPATSGSTTTSLRAAVGYRMRLFQPAPGPELFVKAGYGQSRFQSDSSSEPLSFNTTAFSGLSLGAGAKIPLLDSFGVGFDLNGLLFPSLSETPVTSGNATSVSGWDFHVRGYMNLSPSLELDLRAVFLNYNAVFSGAGTRPTAVTTSSRTSRAVLLGVTKYF